MNFSFDAATRPDTALQAAASDAVLAREAGVPFKPALDIAAQVDPIAEWLSLMEVVQMQCPTWPVRDRPIQGNNWRL